MTQSLDLDAVERVKELDLEALEKVAKAVSTPGDIDSAPESGEYGHKERDKWYACPACDGQGEVDGATFCNFDGKPLGVQFFGIGAEFGEWEAYFRAFRPEIALALLSLLREAEKEKAEAEFAFAILAACAAWSAFGARKYEDAKARAQTAEANLSIAVGALEEAAGHLHFLVRTAEMSSELMLDERRTGRWPGAQKVATQFDHMGLKAAEAKAGVRQALSQLTQKEAGNG